MVLLVGVVLKGCILKRSKLGWFANEQKFHIVATLALGSRPRQGLARVRTKREAESVGECENGHLHSQVSSHFGNWSPSGLSNFQRAIVGVKTHHWRVLYINEKLLKCRCLKWVRMTHLDIWVTSYGQKKGRKSNSWQIGSLTLDH